MCLTVAHHVRLQMPLSLPRKKQPREQQVNRSKQQTGKRVKQLAMEDLGETTPHSPSCPLSYCSISRLRLSCQFLLCGRCCCCIFAACCLASASAKACLLVHLHHLMCCCQCICQSLPASASASPAVLLPVHLHQLLCCCQCICIT